MNINFKTSHFFKKCSRMFLDNIWIYLYRLFRYISISLFMCAMFIVLLYGIYLSVGAAISENNGDVSAFDFVYYNLNSINKSHFFNDFVNLIELCIYTFVFSLFLSFPLRFKLVSENIDFKKSIDLTDIDKK